MKLSNNELLSVYGGVSATLINAVVKGVSLIADLGRSLGNIIKKISVSKTCGI